MFIRNFRPGPKWLEGRIIKRVGPLTYLVGTSLLGKVRRHIDSIRKRTSSDTQPWGTTSLESLPFCTFNEEAVTEQSTPISPEHTEEAAVPEAVPDPAVPEAVLDQYPVVEHNTDTNLRRSTRNRRPPDRFS